MSSFALCLRESAKVLRVAFHVFPAKVIDHSHPCALRHLGPRATALLKLCAGVRVWLADAGIINFIPDSSQSHTGIDLNHCLFSRKYWKN